MKQNYLKSLIILSMCLYLQVVSADPEVLYNKVNLQSSAVREVPNDRMTVILSVEQQGMNPAQVSDRVNRDMEWALELLDEADAIKTSTRSYRTTPVYRDRIISGWRISQELELQSTEFELLTAKVGDLQERLQIRQMVFSPTEATRTRIENELIQEAMTAFRQRAEIVGQQMNGMDYRIVELHISTNGGRNRPVRMMDSAVETAALRAPAVEAGESEIEVTVSGSIQFF